MVKQFFLNEKYMLYAIVLNALVICLLYFPQIGHQYPHFFDTFDLIDHLFVIVFLIEAAVKLATMGRKKYFADGWNVFDFIIVVVSLPSLCHYFGMALIPNTSFLKILRLFRLVRIIRFLRFIPHLDQVISGLGRAIKSSVFVIIALMFLNFILALFTCHFYGNLVPEYFGDPLISSYYIFQMFTVEGWNEIPAVVAEAAEKAGLENASLIAGFARFYFILVVMTGGIFGMSLANAVFVDEMTMDNNKVLEDKIDALEQRVGELTELLKKQENH
ncbi:MAG: ion transporter [Bacteroidota bacterium]